MVDGPWARAERTLNMLSMVVTLDVSKLSGWLNPLAPLNMKLMSVTLDVSRVSGWLNSGAPCRAEMRAYEAGRGAGLEAGEGVEREHGRPIAQTVCTRHAAERTQNIARMSVTLDVSKLSGWLNDCALWRVGRGAHDVGRDAGLIGGRARRGAYESERGADWETGRQWGGCGVGCAAQAAACGMNPGAEVVGQARSAPQTSSSCP